MSDITAQEWSSRAGQYLRQLEARCSDQDLFCIGYLIPQVELVEVTYGDHVGDIDDWLATFIEYVEDCLSKDGVAADDASRIREISNQLAGV
jgi:hypothetical protein